MCNNSDLVLKLALKQAVFLCYRRLLIYRADIDLQSTCEDTIKPTPLFAQRTALTLKYFFTIASDQKTKQLVTY